tara:strand:+ start:165 stop:1160 length:996 start_codon:yes stop_codon:yes gene_type:complete
MNNKSISVLSVSNIFRKSFEINKKHQLKVLATYLLWLLTIWIPYINIGTTIGLKTMVVKITNNEDFSPLDIFKVEHRAYFGEFLLLSFMFYAITLFGTIFFIFTGIIIQHALSQIFYLGIDKKYNFADCFKISYKITFGEKVSIFLVRLSYLVPYIIAILISFTLYGIIYGLNELKYNNAVNAYERWEKKLSDIEFSTRTSSNYMKIEEEKKQAFQKMKNEKIKAYDKYYSWSKYSYRDEASSLEYEYKQIEYSVDARLDSIVNEATKNHRKEEPAYVSSKWRFWNYGENPAYKWLEPILIFFNFIATLCVFVFNTSVSSYIYGQLRKKIS